MGTEAAEVERRDALARRSWVRIPLVPAKADSLVVTSLPI